jgi:hypothetical protein
VESSGKDGSPAIFLWTQSPVQEFVQNLKIEFLDGKTPTASGFAIHRIHSCKIPMHQKTALTFVLFRFIFLRVDG